MKDSNKIIEKRNYSFDKIKVKSIINDFYKSFISSKSTIEKAIEADFKVEKIKLDYLKMLKQIELIKSIELNIFDTKLDKEIKTGIGNIGLMYDGCSYVTIELILKALLTHNDIYLFSTDYMLATNTIILTLIKDAIKKYNYDAKVKHLKVATELFKEVSLNQENFDLLIYIGNKYEFAKIENNFSKPVVFQNFGNIYIYVEPTEEIRETLLQIDKYTYNNGIYLEYITGEDVEAVISKFNEKNRNDMIAIFTKDSKKAFEIISRVNSNKIYINKNPFEDYVYNFNEELLILKKELYY